MYLIYLSFTETVEECSFLKTEKDRLAIENERLRTEISHSQSSNSPQVSMKCCIFVYVIGL